MGRRTGNRKGAPAKKPPALPDIDPKWQAAAVIIQARAAAGLNKTLIAKALGVTKPTLDKWLQGNPALMEIYERGRAEEELLYLTPMQRAAKKGNLVACMFLLKSRCGYRDHGDYNDAASRVNITITLPGALKPEEFAATINNERTAEALAVSGKSLTHP